MNLCENLLFVSDKSILITRDILLSSVLLSIIDCTWSIVAFVILNLPPFLFVFLSNRLNWKRAKKNKIIFLSFFLPNFEERKEKKFQQDKFIKEKNEKKIKIKMLAILKLGLVFSTIFLANLALAGNNKAGPKIGKFTFFI